MARKKYAFNDLPDEVIIKVCQDVKCEVNRRLVGCGQDDECWTTMDAYAFYCRTNVPFFDNGNIAPGELDDKDGGDLNA